MPCTTLSLSSFTDRAFLPSRSSPSVSTDKALRMKLLPPHERGDNAVGFDGEMPFKLEAHRTCHSGLACEGSG